MGFRIDVFESSSSANKFKENVVSDLTKVSWCD